MNKFNKLYEAHILEEGKKLWILVGIYSRESPEIIGVYNHEGSALEDVENYANTYDKVHIYEGSINGPVKEITK